jgi:hypothetical protein
MKTAMQELLVWVRATLPMDLDTPILIEQKIESLLDKEKEQMVDAVVQYLIKHRGLYTEEYILQTVELSEQYYNETFNINEK